MLYCRKLENSQIILQLLYSDYTDVHSVFYISLSLLLLGRSSITQGRLLSTIFGAKIYVWPQADSSNYDNVTLTL